MDPLVTLTDEQIPRLLELLKADLPQSIFSYYLVECLQDWKKRKTSVVCEVMSPQGNFSDATFMAYIRFGKMYRVNIYSSSEAGHQRLEKALATSRRLMPWNEHFKLNPLTPRATQTMRNVIEKITVGGHGRQYSERYDNLLWMTAREASELKWPSVPEDLYLERLRQCHVTEIDGVYAHRCDGSEEMISLTIELNPTVGLFRKSDRRLLSWGMVAFYGGLGIVQTAPEHRRKGYARLVTSHLARVLGDMGKDVHLNVVEGNEAALRCFRSLGFRKLYTSCRLFSLNEETNQNSISLAGTRHC